MKKYLLITILALLGMSQALAQEQECLPLVREGVKWVNEKVIIDHGDTTRYYYTYEISGEVNGPFTKINKACHYYTGRDLDMERDSVIAGLSEAYHFYEVDCYPNKAYDKVWNENRAMLRLPTYTDGGTTILYWFWKSPDDENLTLRFFFNCQEWSMLEEDYFLTTENFIEVEPVEIDGKNCTRCAYIDEQGDTAAYIVETIGFDSRDMGDLLTPFTRKPDPNADHQEYCGLSHVIKDGKIIYKGLRYNPNAVIVLPGDVDGDGEITIGDANSVIDIVVMGGNPSHPRCPRDSGHDPADLNGDGEVNIADVNAIIDLVVKGK